MKRLMSYTLSVLCFLALGGPLPLQAAVTPGSRAPNFSLPGSDGRNYTLAETKGKFVVLQWYNRDCPFIRKHYDSGNMQNLQKTYTGKGVLWFEILSSAPGKEGYLTAAEAQKNRGAEKTYSSATLLDSDGRVGRLYGAKTTPDIFIVDPSGILIYAGAIDDHASADPADIPTSKNYLALALNEAMAGKPVSVPYTKPYGCGVKYR